MKRAQLKKQYCENLMKNGDTRSYNEIKADLEIYIHQQRMKFALGKGDVDIPIIK